MKEPDNMQDLIITIQAPVPRIIEVEFKTLKDGESGQTFIYEGLVQLSRKYVEKIVSTWVHEKMHLLYPELPDRTKISGKLSVHELEAQLMKQLTLAQKVKLFKEIAYLLK